MAVASSTDKFDYLHTTGGTVVAVHKANNTASNKTLIATRDSSVFGGFIYHRTGSESHGLFVARLDVAGVGTSGNSVSATHVTGLTTTLVSVVSLDPDNGTAADRSKVWQNGTALASANAETGTPFVENSQGNLTVGSTPSGASPFDGQVGSVILFNTPSLPTADRQLLENYLIDLQGIT
jgi:hypothetical protein